MLDKIGGLVPKSLKIPITSNMLLFLLKAQEIEGITNLDVAIKDGKVTISGYTRKMLMNIYFSIELEPTTFSGRMLSFRITDLKPLNQEWIKKKVFQEADILYENNIVTFNLNEIDVVKRVPIGKIKSINIDGNKLLVGIGL
jgi:hypothetical protein